VVAQKLNKSKGRVQFFIPTQGWSSLSVKGADLWEPESDGVFAPALREHLRPDIEVSELPMELNTPAFAETIAEALDKMIKEA